MLVWRVDDGNDQKGANMKFSFGPLYKLEPALLAPHGLEKKQLAIYLLS